MGIRLLLALTLLALPLAAQTPIQSGAINTNSYPAPQASYTYTFPKPNTSPCTLFLFSRQSGFTVSDSQKNTWVQDASNVWRTAGCASGQNTITVTEPSVTYFQGVFAEYSQVWIPDVLSAVNSGTSATSASLPVTPQVGDLIIGYGWNDATNAPSITAGAGFTLEQNANIFFEDGNGNASVTYSAVLPWHQATAAYKLLTPVTPPTFDTLTFGIQLVNCSKCDGTDSTPLAAGSIFAGASLSLTQDGQNVCSATFNTSAQASCTGPVNVTPQTVNLLPIVTNPAGTQLNTGQTVQLPSMLAGGAITGNVTLILGFDSATMLPRSFQVYSH